MNRRKRKTARCKRCSRCCTYFCLEIDAPERSADFEDLAWMLAHKKTSIHVDGKSWQLMVKNRCRYLTGDGSCRIYDERPRICRQHLPGKCDYGTSSMHDYDDADLVFTTIDELRRYRDQHFPLKKGPRRKARGRGSRKPSA